MNKFESDFNPMYKFHCSYDFVYEPIYDTSYNMAFVFYDEDELGEDDDFATGATNYYPPISSEIQ